MRMYEELEIADGKLWNFNKQNILCIYTYLWICNKVLMGETIEEDSGERTPVPTYDDQIKNVLKL